MSSTNLSSGYNVAIQNRKFAKTCVEKRRRDRINKCLDELKDLMSQADDKAKYQKMEKAEILEMAVNYMKNVRSNSNIQSTSSVQIQSNEQPSIQMQCLAFKQCLAEFQNYLSLFPDLKDDFKNKVMSYMSQRYVEKLNQLKRKHSLNKVFKRSDSNRYQPYSTNDLNINTSDHLFNANSKSIDSGLSESNSKMNNDSHNESSISDNLIMSPILSTSSLCSSPTQLESSKFNILSSSSSPISFYSNYDEFMKVWRPW